MATYEELEQLAARYRVSEEDAAEIGPQIVKEATYGRPFEHDVRSANRFLDAWQAHVIRVFPDDPDAIAAVFNRRGDFGRWFETARYHHDRHLRAIDMMLTEARSRRDAMNDDTTNAIRWLLIAHGAVALGSMSAITGTDGSRFIVELTVAIVFAFVGLVLAGCAQFMRIRSGRSLVGAQAGTMVVLTNPYSEQPARMAALRAAEEAGTADQTKNDTAVMLAGLSMATLAVVILFGAGALTYHAVDASLQRGTPETEQATISEADTYD